MDLRAVGAEIRRVMKIEPSGKAAVQDGGQQFGGLALGRGKRNCLERMFEYKALFGISRADPANRTLDALRDENVGADETFREAGAVHNGAGPPRRVDCWQGYGLECIRAQIRISRDYRRGRGLIILDAGARLLRRFESLSNRPISSAVEVTLTQCPELPNECVQSLNAAQVLK